jgi:hypothetical protein
MSATKAAPRSSRPTSVREDANTPPKYSVDTMLCSRLRARRPSWSRPSRSVSPPDSQRRRSSSERTAHRKEELNIRIAWDHPRRSGRYTQPASTWFRAHVGFYVPSPATLSFRHRAPTEVEESAAPRYQPCHPERSEALAERSRGTLRSVGRHLRHQQSFSAKRLSEALFGYHVAEAPI